jgi:large subunit ribosomal protein L22
MEAKAIVRNVRMTPRKMKLICDLIRGKDAATAMAIIKNTPKAASEVMEKLLGSAMANAENNFNLDVSNLFVKEVHVAPGPIMKRIMPRAQGRAFRILKRTCHVTLVLAEKE